MLATTDLSGQVNQAIYAKPTFLDKDDDATCSFVMANRLTHDNIDTTRVRRIYSLKKGAGYIGKRLSLTVLDERARPEKIKAVRQPAGLPLGIGEEESKYLVHFHIEGVRR